MTSENYEILHNLVFLQEMRAAMGRKKFRAAIFSSLARETNSRTSNVLAFIKYSRELEFLKALPETYDVSMPISASSGNTRVGPGHGERVVMRKSIGLMLTTKK